ncbi:tumor necrosis factor receptor superfamily member 14 isoform X1 [Danio aesculapii]|uniref:tumor necrosis factor receptor superfamily member 14 isoform X1 n=1 Tax=Danio aesculapii TaxID=1142201 RepID=UPI0024BF69F4|nr:tumor necrosis factor receptor superfamily member 14 isoform X1 [Danio aesculapii]
MGDDKCQKCPKGKFMRAKCNSSQSTVCETCPHDQFIDVENSVTECRPCRKCTSDSYLVVEKECQADKNTQCKCKPGYYCKHPTDNNSYCDHCTSVSNCPLGQGVAIQHTPTTDTVCKPCPEGTYSDKVDNWSSCKNHTSCDDLGRQVKNPGTNISDVQCGDYKCNLTCSWALPASLWTGFVLSVLVVFLVLYIIYRKNKRRSKSSEITLSTISPVLPPDILKYPADCDVEKCAELHHCLTHIENYPDLDGSIQSDGAKPLMTMSPKYSQSTAAGEYADSIMKYSICQSEPQESEWTD